MSDLNQKKIGWKQKLLHELKEYWSNVLYMAIFFAVFSNYRRLILAHYQISYKEYGVSVVKALILAKVIIVAEKLGVGRRFEHKPLIVSTLYKVFLFTICVLIFNILESMVRSFIHGMGPMCAADNLMSQFNHEWFAESLVVFFAFIPFFAVRELRRVLGEGTITRLFFKRDWPSSISLNQSETVKKDDEPTDS